MTRARRKKPAPPPTPSLPIVGEMFATPQTIAWAVENMTRCHDEPSCVNATVRFRRYRITVEEVAEPVEVLHERLRQLWYLCDNHHEWDPIREAAKEVGLTLDIKDVGKLRRRVRGD